MGYDVLPSLLPLVPRELPSGLMALTLHSSWVGLQRQLVADEEVLRFTRLQCLGLPAWILCETIYPKLHLLKVLHTVTLFGRFDLSADLLMSFLEGPSKLTSLNRSNSLQCMDRWEPRLPERDFVWVLRGWNPGVIGSYHGGRLLSRGSRLKCSWLQRKGMMSKWWDR